MKVILAIDSSAASESVIEEAASLPWRPGTIFCVMTVVDMGEWEGLPALIADAKQGAETLVARATGKLRRSGCEVNSEVQLGLPKKAISEFAHQWQADLVMLGSHGLSALTRFLVGSVAQAVLRSSPCSVEIVRRKAVPSESRRDGLKMLIGTDGSECSVKAIYSIANRAWPRDTVVRVMCVRELLPVESKAIASAPYAIYPESVVNEIFDRARIRTETAVEDARTILNRAGLALLDQPKEMPVGDPRTILLDEANAWQADLIVVGSHGRHGLNRLLLGSVSETVALHAHCSVEIVHG